MALGPTRPESDTYQLYFLYCSGLKIKWSRTYYVSWKNLEHILDAVVWRWCECKVMVIFKRHVAHVNHHRLRKYFTNTHPAPTGTIFIPIQIELLTLKNNVIIWCTLLISQIQLTSFPLYLHDTSAKIAVDKILSTDPDKCQVFRLQPNFDFSTESQ